METRDRIEATKDVDGITVRIKTSKNWYILLFLPVWLTAWTFFGIAAISAIVTRQHPVPVLLIWLCGWAVGETWAICVWLWSAFGQEKISVRDGLFTHKREVFGKGFARVFPVDELFNLRASGYFGTMSVFGNSLAQVGLTGGTVAVDTKYGDTYRFGIHLEEREAVALARTLEPYLHRNI